MGYLPPTTIAETLRRIQRRELILPAIQREYVWSASQVIGVFDSVMRGYPIGGFLSWRVESETAKKFKFYGFLKNYNALDNRHNSLLDVVPGQPVTAMLDGQQRLTSLNIGLRGSFAYRVRGGWYNNPKAYPERRLYLNVLGEAEENDAGLRYDFRFLTSQQLDSADDSKHWFPVNKIFEAEKMAQLWAFAAQSELANNETATDILSQMWEAIHSNQSLHFYEEVDQDVERVLDIFIRVNSGGTVLSYSDLLLSIATAQWKERDARDAIHGLVDALNNTGDGFNFSQDVVLKSGLVLAGVGDIAFKVKNFTAENMATLDRKWDAISESLTVAVGLLSDFGLSDATLSADSVIIPVAYYVHRRRLTENYRVNPGDAADRAALRSWVLRSLIVRGVWGSGLDTLLRDLRQIILDQGADEFPLAAIERVMAARGKSLAVTDELVEDVLDLAYGGARTFAVLAVLFDHVDTQSIKFHVDHVFPRALLDTKVLKQHGFDSDEIDDLQWRRDRLGNLQLITGPYNIAKSAVPPDDWATKTYTTPDMYDSYIKLNELSQLPHTASEFVHFFDMRRAALAKRLRRKLAGSAASPVVAGEPDILSTSASIEDELVDASLND